MRRQVELHEASVCKNCQNPYQEKMVMKGGSFYVTNTIAPAIALRLMLSRVMILGVII
ncbi:MAG: hypothetical protein WBG46_13770 [Nonlabens sp.]